MANFKFELSEIVCFDPLNEVKSAKGKVIGRTEYLDGSVGYSVTCLAFGAGPGTVRNAFAEAELHKVEPK